MQFSTYPHRYSDIILNADYGLKQETEAVVRAIEMPSVLLRFEQENQDRRGGGKREARGKQGVINAMFREEFQRRGWEVEKNVFNDPENDLAIIDFWKREIGVDVAFNRRSFVGGDLLRLQAGGEVKNVIKVGVYICPTKMFAKEVSPNDASSMVSFERVCWYLQSFYPVFTVPILVIGLRA